MKQTQLYLITFLLTFSFLQVACFENTMMSAEPQQNNSLANSEDGQNSSEDNTEDEGSNEDSEKEEISLEKRMAAAQATAQSDSNGCAAIQPFYWEIGDKTAKQVYGSVGVDVNGESVKEDSVMNIASATKWIYSSYVLEKNKGQLSNEDIQHLSFRSGHTNFKICTQGSTVGSCAEAGTNGDYSPETDGYFYYNGGHMQVHGALNGLAELNNQTLSEEINRVLGSDLGIQFSQPQLAGGAVWSAQGYAQLLRKILNKELYISNYLGAHKVCASPELCPDEALSSPMRASEKIHYSLGHWVEDDPEVGDGAYSSAGAFGFYPWIDKEQKWYGVISRHSFVGGGQDSMFCGRLIRKAWVTGVAQ